ncbi:beta-lactamase family protein [Radiobacillus kanasensis]|uniref:serine hydrolase domain-containing protein n=1 Tax=Radiobacillus kanasensis TaxID=2844358 RepID=UPI001E58C2FE|nr:serine hydrolase domain-containing protein [Radiobacillus kanasensis]UFT98186.1 beta-lactamase family protein [Radiobacillus kanasensis]
MSGLDSSRVTEMIDSYGVRGLSIATLKQGEVFTEAFGVKNIELHDPVTEETLFNACSMSKLVTSLLVLLLVDREILSLDEDVNQKLKSWRVPDDNWTSREKVTLRMLLSHQSGIKDPLHSFGELDFHAGFPIIKDLLAGRTPYCQEAVEVRNEPGTTFEYSDAGFCIIQQLIEDVCKELFEEVMKQEVFIPLQMMKSRYVRVKSELLESPFSLGYDKDGQEVTNSIYPYPAAAGLWTTPSELMTILIEIMDSIHGKGKLGLSPNFIKEMFTPQGEEWIGLGVFIEGKSSDVEMSSLGWGKGFQSMLVAYPLLRTGVVMMTNTDLGVHQMKGLLGDIYKIKKGNLIT